MNPELFSGSVRTLYNGITVPALGLGVWQMRGAETKNACLHALKYGYRHIDTAAFYGNEKEVGAAVRESGLQRNAVFVTTKLWNDDQGYDRAIRAFNDSLKKLNIGAVDLYLIHWPEPGLRKDSWRALETLYEEGNCRAIGVSNYTIRHLEELFGYCKIPPMVNQVEFHPFLYQKELLDFCKKHQIVLESYSPLTKGIRLKEKRLTAIAERYGKSNAQIMIRWILQHGAVVLPKSSTLQRIEANATVFGFSISDEDMIAINALNENWRCTWDPTNEP